MRYVEIHADVSKNDAGIYVGADGTKVGLEKAIIVDESERKDGRHYRPLDSVGEKFLENLKKHPEVKNVWISDEVTEKKKDSLWYGGLICELDIERNGKTYHVGYRAIGDVIGYLYYRGNETRIKDKGNNGELGYELSCLGINEDDKVEFCYDGYCAEAEQKSAEDPTKAYVYLENDNWFECWCQDKNGEYISDGWDIINDIDEVIDIDGLIDIIAECEEDD